MGIVNYKSQDEAVENEIGKAEEEPLKINVVNLDGENFITQEEKQYVVDPQLDWLDKDLKDKQTKLKDLLDKINEEDEVIEANIVKLGTVEKTIELKLKHEKKSETLNETLESCYLRLESIYRENKKILEQMDEVVMNLLDEKGIGYHWQDPESGAVFMIKDAFDKSNVSYRQQAFSRYFVAHTLRKQYGEKQGTLTLTEAKELGYKI